MTRLLKFRALPGQCIGGGMPRLQQSGVRPGVM